MSMSHVLVGYRHKEVAPTSETREVESLAQAALDLPIALMAWRSDANCKREIQRHWSERDALGCVSPGDPAAIIAYWRRFPQREMAPHVFYDFDGLTAYVLSSHDHYLRYLPASWRGQVVDANEMYRVMYPPGGRMHDRLIDTLDDGLDPAERMAAELFLELDTSELPYVALVVAQALCGYTPSGDDLALAQDALCDCCHADAHQLARWLQEMAEWPRERLLALLDLYALLVNTAAREEECEDEEDEEQVEDCMTTLTEEWQQELLAIREQLQSYQQNQQTAQT